LLSNGTGTTRDGGNECQIIGATDERGERVVGAPIRMQNVLSTLYGLLEIDPATTFRDHNGRPQYVLKQRDPVPGLA
jgi:hypothetical protein